MDGKKPLISVIVPVYKVEKYLPRCLDSLLAQTWEALEIILVDDGSPDDSWLVMQDYERRDARVRNFRKENGGVSSARNFGMERAEGEYISFVDPDDWVAPHYLEWLYEAMQEQGTRIALADYQSIEEAGQLPEEAKERPEAVRITPQNYPQTGRSTGGHAWRTLYHRGVVEKLRFDQSLHYAEDILFFTQAVVLAGAYAYLDTPLYYYMKRSGSAMEQTFSMKQYDEITGWKRAFALVQGQPEPMKKSVETRLLVACAHVYYRMQSSPCADGEALRALREEARRHKDALPALKNQNLREKGKVLMMLLAPSLGSMMWKLAKRRRASDKRGKRNGQEGTADLGHRPGVQCGEISAQVSGQPAGPDVAEP